MVSVIQEPKRDPDARTVMGLLTPVNFPQPGGWGQTGNMHEETVTPYQQRQRLQLKSNDLWSGILKTGSH